MDALALKNHKPPLEIAGFLFCPALRQHLHSGRQATQQAHLGHVSACRHGQSNGGSKRRRTARTYLLGTRAGACDY